MSNTHKQKARKKRLGIKTFLTEKMADRRCGSIDDKVDKMATMDKINR